MIKFYISEVIDKVVQDNFRKLQNFFNSDPWLNSGFKTLEIGFSADNQTKNIAHGLGVIPTDIFITWQKWTGTAGTITINYNAFDETNINITSTKPCTLRVFVGRYKGRI